MPRFTALAPSEEATVRYRVIVKLNFNSTDKKYLTTQRVTPALPSVPTTFP